jgi:P27 family predicted phage terminase small subunit
MARPAKPVEKHMQDGTFRKDRHNLPVVIGERKLPDTPTHLNTLQKALWDVVVEDTGSFLTSTDFPTIEAFVVLLSRAREAREIINREGIVVDDKKHPMLEVERLSLNALKPYIEQLGLSPSARARLGLMAVQGMSAQEKLSKELGDSPLDIPPENEVIDQ